MTRYRIYYADGSTYAGDPYQATPAGVQAIAVETAAAPGFLVLQGKDYYVWRDAQWLGVDWGGLWDYLLLAVGPKAVLSGRSIRDADYWAIVGRAAREGLGPDA